MDSDKELDDLLEQELLKIQISDEEEEDKVTDKNDGSVTSYENEIEDEEFLQEIRELQAASASHMKYYEDFLNDSKLEENAFDTVPYEEYLLKSLESKGFSKADYDKMLVEMLEMEKDMVPDENLEPNLSNITPLDFGSNSNALLENSDEIVPCGRTTGRSYRQIWDEVDSFLKDMDSRGQANRERFLKEMEHELEQNNMKSNRHKIETEADVTTLKHSMEESIRLLDAKMTAEKARIIAFQKELENNEHEERQKAAIFIQKVYRGYRIRSRIGAEIATCKVNARKKVDKKRMILIEKNMQLFKARKFERERKQKGVTSKTVSGSDSRASTAVSMKRTNEDHNEEENRTEMDEIKSKNLRNNREVTIVELPDEVNLSENIEECIPEISLPHSTREESEKTTSTDTSKEKIKRKDEQLKNSSQTMAIISAAEDSSCSIEIVASSCNDSASCANTGDEPVPTQPLYEVKASGVKILDEEIPSAELNQTNVPEENIEDTEESSTSLVPTSPNTQESVSVTSIPVTIHQAIVEEMMSPTPYEATCDIHMGPDFILVECHPEVVAPLPFSVAQVSESVVTQIGPPPTFLSRLYSSVASTEVESQLEVCQPLAKFSQAYQQWKQSLNQAQSSESRPESNRVKNPRRSSILKSHKIPVMMDEWSLLLNVTVDILQTLTVVELSHCQPVSLDVLVDVCPLLQIINISHSQIEKVTRLDALQSLRFVSLQHNHLQQFLVESPQHPALLYLDLSHNDMKRSPLLEAFPHLMVADLSHNKLAQFSQQQCNVALLNLAHNDLYSLLLDVWPNLQELNISHNNLTSFPQLKNTPILRKLDVSSNSIRALPSNFDWPLLHWVSLDENAFTNVQPLAHWWLPCLLELHAAHNSIVEWPTQTCCPLLQVLDVSNNQLLDSPELRRLFAESFPKLENLHIMIGESDFHQARLTYQETLPNLQTLNGATLLKDTSNTKRVNSFLVDNSDSFSWKCRQFVQFISKKEEQLQRRLDSALTSQHRLRIYEGFVNECTLQCGRYRLFQETGSLPESTSETIIRDNRFTVDLHQRRQAAAIKIQALWRGHMTRQWISRVLGDVRQDVSDSDESMWDDEKALEEMKSFTDVDPWADLECMTAPLSVADSSRHPILAKQPTQAWPSAREDVASGPLDFHIKDLQKQAVVGQPNLAGVSSRRTPHSIATIDDQGASVLDFMDEKTSRKKQQIMQEWGFQNEQAAELFLQRAKKMKLNAANKRKIKNLGPKERLDWIRKNDQHNSGPVSKRSQSREPVSIPAGPAKRDYAREDLQQNEENVGSGQSRTYQWVFQHGFLQSPVSSNSGAPITNKQPTSQSKTDDFFLPRIPSAERNLAGSQTTSVSQKPKKLPKGVLSIDSTLPPIGGRNAKW